MSSPDDRQDKPQPQASWAAFASMGMTMAVCVAAGVLLGLWADSALGTSPLFLFVGLIAGCAVAVVAVVQLVRRAS